MAENGKRRRNLTPESRFYDTLKGQQVYIELSDNVGARIVATLLWVDRYSVGIRCGEEDLLLNKRSIRTIGRAQPTRERHNGARDYSGEAL